jgi:hypothetical protein
MAPLEADPEAAHSLRPSAGGARVGTAPRACAVAPPPRQDGLLKPSCTGGGPGPGVSRAGLVPGRSETRTPSTEPLLSISVRLVRRGLHRGMRADLAIGLHPLHPSRECRTVSDLVQASDLRPRWTTRLAGPFGSPRSRRQDATAPLLQPTFTSRALDIDSTSGDCPPAAVSKPTAHGFEADPRGRRGVATCRPGSAPDHLAVIRPPAAACLTARPPASARSTAARTLSRPCGRAPALFRLTGRPVDRHPLIPPSGGWSWSR